MIPKSTTLVFLGRSGCGKDTQIEFLLRREEFKDAVKIVMGDAFRELAQKKTIFGRKIKQILDEGERQPWWLAAHLWISRLETFADKETLLIDGTPRTLKEAKLLDEVLEFVERPRALALLLEVSREEARDRLLFRARSDDAEEQIKNRLDYYERDVIPAIEYFRKERRLVEVNGEKTRNITISGKRAKKIEAAKAKEASA